MKNKLFYLIGVAGLLSYTGTFTSCVNGVDDEYLEQKITEGTGSDEEGEELPDLNGEYSMVGDFELTMTCNGEPLDGKKVVLAVDETNESATITFSATETDIESVIGELPGGIGGLLSGMGLKYTGNSPVPGEKEITITNVPLFRNGMNYMFKGELIQPTYTMNYDGKIEEEKMTVDIKYELTNQKLAGTWKLQKPNIMLPSPQMTPLWYDWDTNLKIRFGEIYLEVPGMGTVPLNIDAYTPNELQQLLFMISPVGWFPMFDLQQMVADMLQSITAMPNGSLYATYAWDSDTSNPDRWSSNMGRNIIRYYYGEKEDRLYVELDGQFIINTIRSFINPAPGTRSVEDDLKVLGTKLIEILKPALENGIPCTYKLEGNKMALNIDGEYLLEVLKVVSEVANNEVANTYLMEFLKSDPTLGAYAENIGIFLKRLPDLLTYKDETSNGTKSGECKYVKIGLHLER